MSKQVEMTEIPACDFCAQNQADHPREATEIRPAMVDGRTIYGAWAYMCERHWREHGCGQLGTGHGQRLILAKVES